MCSSKYKKPVAFHNVVESGKAANWGNAKNPSSGSNLHVPLHVNAQMGTWYPLNREETQGGYTPSSFCSIPLILL